MARKSSLFHVRTPRLTVSKSGKVRFSGGGVRIGGRSGGVNISKSGVSTSSRVGPVRYNSRRGCALQLAVLLVLGVGPLLVRLLA